MGRIRHRLALGLVALAVSLAPPAQANPWNVSLFGAPVPDELAPEPESVPAPGRLTLGGLAGEQSNEGYLDALVPLLDGERGRLLLNPRVSGTDGDEQQLSVGFVARQLLPWSAVVLGANVFCDSRRTAHDSRFDQVGAGVECLSTWIDARANYYWPQSGREIIGRASDQRTAQSIESSFEDPYAAGHAIVQDERIVTTTTTTTRQYERFEAALEGYDAEIGLRVPLPGRTVEARVFGGYYGFQREFAEDLHGWRSRLEIRAGPALIFDAEWYEDDALKGSDFLVGARLSVPFDLANLARGRNPFAGAFQSQPRTPQDRLTESVMRDLHVRTEESDYIENAALRQVTERTKTDLERHVLLDDVQFVDNRNAAGVQRGTAEDPFDTVQGGVNAAYGKKNVYVSAGQGPYRENVTISQDGVRLLGEGVAIAGLGGRPFGGGRFPVIDGQVGDVNRPTLRVSGDHVWVQGFEILHAPGGADPGAADALGFGFPVDRVGVLAENANDLTLLGNRLHDNTHGALVLTDRTGPGGAPDSRVTLLENVSWNNTDAGFLLSGAGHGGGSFTAVLGGNTAHHNGLGGLLVTALQYDKIHVDVSRGSFHHNQGPGALLGLVATDAIDLRIAASSFHDNQGMGLRAIAVSSASSVQAQVNGVSASGNAGTGLNLNLRAGEDVRALLQNILATGNDGLGVDVRLQSLLSGRADLLVRDAFLSGNSGDGLATSVSAPGGTSVILERVQQ